MFFPEYTITGNTLKNIANIEYCKGIIEAHTLLPRSIKKLQAKAETRTIYFSLVRDNYDPDFESINRYILELPTTPSPLVVSYQKALEHLDQLARRREFREQTIDDVHKIFSNNNSYRNTSLENCIPPDEILANISSLLDWFNSIDAKDAHPIVTSAIIKAQIEYIAPFQKDNVILSDLITKLLLKTYGYSINDYISLEEYYIQTKRDYEKELRDAFKENDFTRWIEYFTEGINSEVSNICEEVKILEREAMIAKIAGPKTRLSARQIKLIDYLEDFGYIQNKDFIKLFPNISEDTVLRELAKLIKKNIIVKRGKTKSSRYELA